MRATSLKNAKTNQRAVWNVIGGAESGGIGVDLPVYIQVNRMYIPLSLMEDGTLRKSDTDCRMAGLKTVSKPDAKTHLVERDILVEQ